MPTIKDVAEHAGVSLASASYAFSGKRAVSEEVRRRVMAAAAALNYQPSALGRNLRKGRNHRIGLITSLPSELSGWRVMEMLSAAEEEASTHGYTLSFYRPSAKPSQALELAQNGQVDGLIVLQVRQQDERVELLRRSQIPFVMIGDTLNAENLSFVDLDAERATFRAFEHLAQLGHKHVGYLAPQRRGAVHDLGRDLHIAQGYARAKGQLDLNILELEAGSALQEGHAATVRLLREHPEITAFFSPQSNNQYGLLQALYAQQIRVPRDCSVITFSNESAAESAVPPLTAVTLPLSEMGRLAARMLIGRLEHGGKGEQILLPPKLVVRESTAPPRKKPLPKLATV
jgi:DNA-binding LacI/PurR family transcriptional regulator